MRRCIAVVLTALAASACKDPAPTTGTLVVNITGLPASASALVRITGPENYLKTLNASATLNGLLAGEYIVRIDTILDGNTKYGSPVFRDTIMVGRGEELTTSIAYNISSGSLDLTINGLPSGTPAAVQVYNASFSANANLSGVLSGLLPGKYYVRADTFTTVQGDLFGAATVLDSVTVAASTTSATASVTYALSSATLALTVSGLPSSFNQQPVTVTGPNSYTQKFASSQTIRGLRGGAYTISAVNANGTCPAIYRTSPTPQNISLTIGSSTSATVSYVEGTANAADLNLKIEGVHVIQVSQNPLWSVPMVAGRAALVRVFGVANQCNDAKPKVRITIGGAAPVTVDAPETTVRFQTDERTLLSTWNYNVPANLVQSGMTIVAEIDSDGAVAETNEADNRYPATGSRQVLVRTVPTFGLKFVPITQTVNGAPVTGDIAGKTDQFLDWSRRLLPIKDFDVKVREAYTTTAGTLGSTGSNWQAVLQEIDALRVADPVDSKRYHYGIAKVSYNSGVAGIGYVPGKAAMGWDHNNTGSGSQVMAHELGHNLSMSHTPCGGPNNPDPSYPNTGFYTGGRIGVIGYDQVSQTLKDPEIYTDIMGYCNSQWISDYSYVRMLDYLSDPNREPSMMVAGASVRQPGLLIWGRIQNGVPVLEPAFEIDALPSTPRDAGRNRIVALDASGGEILSLAFDGARVSDLPGDNENFSFVIPLSALRGRTIASLRLTARGRTATNVAATSADADPGIVATRPSSGRVRLRWDATRHPVLMVRNPATGNVIAFARGGDATIAASQDEIEVNASNRVRSARRTVRVLR
jgi:hypothetical protein